MANWQHHSLGAATAVCRSTGTRKVLLSTVAMTFFVQLAWQLVDPRQDCGGFTCRRSVIQQRTPLPPGSRRSAAQIPSNLSAPATGLPESPPEEHAATASLTEASPPPPDSPRSAAQTASNFIALASGLSKSSPSAHEVTAAPVLSPPPALPSDLPQLAPQTPSNFSASISGFSKSSPDAHEANAVPALSLPPSDLLRPTAQTPSNFGASTAGLPESAPDALTATALPKVEISPSTPPPTPPSRRRLVLLWTAFFGRSFEDAMKGSFPPSQHCDQQCELTSDWQRASEADAVLFHAADTGYVLPDVRRAAQLWVLFNLEPPAHGTVLPQVDHLFNLTMTYRSDSDIEVGYGHTETLDITLNGSSPAVPPTLLPSLAAANFTKRKPYAYWMVSNCEDARMAYVRELAKHIQVDVYGKCAPPGSRMCNGSQDATTESDCEAELSATYAFYIAFENSLCPDYVTEKLWRALSSPGGAIPVVIGAPPSRYAQIAPPGSYVHAQSFATPRKLAAHLKRVASSHEHFVSYHRWRERHLAHVGWYYEFASGLCRLCELVHSNEGRSRPAKANVSGWFSSGCVTSWPMGHQLQSSRAPST